MCPCGKNEKLRILKYSLAMHLLMQIKLYLLKKQQYIFEIY